MPQLFNCILSEFHQLTIVSYDFIGLGMGSGRVAAPPSTSSGGCLNFDRLWATAEWLNVMMSLTVT